MKKEHRGSTLVLAGIMGILILASFSSAAEIKIVVVVENASIYSNPSLESEVVRENVPLGATFETEKTEGDWYEIRFRNSLGVSVTGYIHKMYVEVQDEPQVEIEEPEEPEEPEEKPAPPPAPRVQEKPKGAFAVMGGLGMGSFFPENTTYSSSWNEGILDSVIESGLVTHEIGSPIGAGISFSYPLMGGLGIRARVDYNLPQQITEENTSDYNISWTWTSGGSYSREKSWPVTGDFSLIPLSLNVIYKVQSDGSFIPYVSGGVSYITGKATLDSSIGYGVTWTSGGYRYIDYVDIPVTIDSSISSLGFNVGGGVDFLFTPNIALTVDGTYFIGGDVEVDWAPIAGTYSGNSFPNVTWTLNQSAVEALAGEAPPLEISTSFLKIQAGIKFLF